VPLGMATNLYFGCFPFLGIKSLFSIFQVLKRICYLKEVPKMHIKIAPPQFSKILYLISCTNHQLVVCPNLSIYLSRKRKTFVDSVESGENLKYNDMMVCS
jgi:hypothetical protein